MSLEIILGGAALFLLLSGKKKAGTTSGTGGDHGSLGPDAGPRSGPGGRRGGKGTGGSGGSGTGAPANLPVDMIWVSPDCQEVVYGDGTGDAFWDRYGMATAQGYVNANYRDPYEIAIAVATPFIQHCPGILEKFPIAEDDYDPMEEELHREFFNRDHKDVYYLIQFFHDKCIELLGDADRLIVMDDRCNVEYVGENWHRLVADKMIRYYLEYMYPRPSPMGHTEAKYPAWPLADPTHIWMGWQGGIVTAVINRLSPVCGVAIVEALKKEPHSAASFFASRPEMKRLYDDLYVQVDHLDDNRVGGLDFDLIDELYKGSRGL